MYNNQFYIIQGWMVNELKLKGNELICYAVIYGFCKQKIRYDLNFCFVKNDRGYLTIVMFSPSIFKSIL